MIKRKLKACALCGEPSYLFAKGLCKECWAKMYGKGINRAARKKIAWQSDTYKARMKKYRELRETYLAEHPHCEVCGTKAATEIHHKKKRTGNNLFRHFLAVDRECHRQIEENPQWAYEKGYSIPHLKKDE